MVSVVQVRQILFRIVVLVSILGGTLANESCSADKNCPKGDQNLYSKSASDDVLVYTVATESTDGYDRYLISAEEYGIKPIVLGFGQEWQGGDDIKRYPGGGWKVNLFLEALQPHRDEKEKIAIFTDAYDVVFLNNLDEIVKRFKATGAKVLFGAENYCWPDASLTDKYPEVEQGYRFLNSGLYIGYIPQLLDVLEREKIKNNDDDQLFFTKAYLDAEFRNKVQLKLDHKAEIFQNLNGAKDIELIDVVQKEGPSVYEVRNNAYGTKPAVLHGNGPSKINLNYLSNYAFNSWNTEEGCVHCKKNQLDLSNRDASEMPSVVLAVFVTLATPFLEEHLEKVHELDYPRSKIHLFVYNSEKYHVRNVTSFIDRYGGEYASVKQIVPDDSINEHKGRDLSLAQCLAKNCDYYFAVDSVAHLDNPNALRLLMEQNRRVVAPMLTRSGKAWSNFWGALTKDGYYARSNDYMDIVFNTRRGLWNVPFITNCYLINASVLRKYDKSKLNFSKDHVDADMSLCTCLRELDIFMLVTNIYDFGHLVNPETYDITRAEPEMYQIFDNEIDWEKRFIHPDYAENFNPEKKPMQPCPDVYWFPITNRRFCNALINMMENFGQWSDGSNQDNRLEGGYEAVPTRDIHMTQVGFDKHWLYFLSRFVRPLQEHVFTGYYHDPPKSLMNFVVRYRPDEQPFLKPHHDSSTYTINIALNERGVDYEGGGCRFIRYNCSMVDTKPGWVLMHPGRLTHYHEGLLVTKGTRYIMISFVDP